MSEDQAGCAQDDHILAQLRSLNLGMSGQRGQNILAHSLLHRGDDSFTIARQPTGQDDLIDIERAGHLRRGDPQVIPSFGDQFLNGWVASLVSLQNGVAVDLLGEATSRLR